MYESSTCRVLDLEIIPSGDEQSCVVDTLERKVVLTGVDSKIEKHWPVIEELLKQADGYYEAVLAERRLFHRGWRVRFEGDGTGEFYSRVNSLTKTITLFNLSDKREEDWNEIKCRLAREDLSYSSC